MATGFVIGSIILGVAFAYFYRPKPQGPDMAPATLDSFNVTTATEGSVVPEVFGRVRLPGNIIWYGNLVAEEVTAETGGKGGGGGKQTVGYKYYLDVWEALCMGKVSMVKAYVDNKERALSAQKSGDLVIGVGIGRVDFNDGTEATYPAEPGVLANRIPGVAHVFWEKMYLGENKTFVPTVHFVLDREYSPGNINHPVLTKGHNPAAIIYYLLTNAGAPVEKINVPMFNDAADFWYSKDYGLNINFSRQARVRDHIAQVLSYVGGVLGEDTDGRFYIKAFDPDDVSVATIAKDSTHEDFIDFTLQRKTWRDTYNVFVGNFIDEDREFSKRTVVARNLANANLQGRKRVRTLDLTAFRDATTASKRLWEVMKEESYPAAEIAFTTNLSFSKVLVGQVVTITHDEYGIADAEFRITEKDTKEIDKNEISFKAKQKTEKLFDSTFQTSGLSAWVTPAYSPSAFVHQKIFELPFSSAFEHEPAILMLGAREHSFETGWNAYVSNLGVDYAIAGSFSGFSQYGTLDQTYPAATFDIDDDTGIYFTPYRDDPPFETISRTDLFSKMRFALMGDEIVRFEKVIPVGSDSYKLEGVVRGVANTTPAQHNSGTDIWLFNLSNNVLTGFSGSSLYVKMTPFTANEIVDISDAIALNLSISGLAKIPWPVSRIEAVRSGSSIAVSWWPVNQDNPGAGTAAEDAQTDTDPFLYDGDFQIYEGVSGIGSAVAVDGTTKTLTQAAACTVFVRARRAGFNSDWKSVYVPAVDGTYIGPDA